MRLKCLRRFGLREHLQNHRWGNFNPHGGRDAAKALENSHRGYVLEMGNNRFEGNAKDLLEKGEVRHLYPGG